jgi:ElaB/YqjD/DUF883 family membrane-anchored ribosome-binding protein
MGTKRGSGEEKLILVGGKRPQMRKARAGGWTAAKRSDFLAALRATCNIAAALRRVRLSRSGLDRLRARDGAFRAAFREAIRDGYPELELFAMEKIMNGTVKTVTKTDGTKETRETVHEYPLHLAIQLLRQHRETAIEAEAEHQAEDVDEARARILRKLKRLKERLDREQGAAGRAAGGE